MMNYFVILTAVLAITGETFAYLSRGGGYVAGVAQQQQQSSTVVQEKSASSSAYGVDSVYGGGAGIVGSEYSSGYGAASAASTEVYQSQQYASSGSAASVVGGSAYDGYGSSGLRSSYGGSSYRSQQSSYSSVQSKTSVIQSWPNLPQDNPFLLSLCQLDSLYTSAELASNFLAKQEVDIYSLASIVYQRNPKIQQYLRYVLGFATEQEVERKLFFKSIQEVGAAPYVRAFQLYLLHPTIFQSSLADLIVNKASAEVVQSLISSSNIQFATYQDTFRSIISSRTYRSALFSLFGVNDEYGLWGAFRNAFETNRAAFFYSLRHVLLRRNLLSYPDYFYFDYSQFGKRYSYFQKRYIKSSYSNYISKYQTYKQESFSQTTSTSSASSTSAYSDVNSGVIGTEGYATGYGVRQASVQSQSVKQAEYSSSEVVGAGISSSGIGSGISSGVASSGYSSKTVSQQTTVSSSKTSVQQCTSYWPSLCSDSVFQRLYDVDSVINSVELLQKIQISSFDYQSTISSYFQKNKLLQSYFLSAVGIQLDSFDSATFYKIVQQQPAPFWKLALNFIKHPTIFQSKLSEFLFTTATTEIVTKSESLYSSYFQESYISSFVKVSSYRTLLARAFQCEASEAALVSRLKWAYSRNSAGTLLLLKHILTQRSLLSIDEYFSISRGYLEKRATEYYSRVFAQTKYYKTYRSFKSSSSTSVRTTKSRRIKSKKGKVRGFIKNKFGKNTSSSD